MTLALLIVVTSVVAVLAAVFIALFLSHRKTNSSYAALFVVFLVAAVFSGIVLALYCVDSNELSLSDILSFYGTIASVLASAYLGYVVYKIEKDEISRNNSCCCIINKIDYAKEEPKQEPELEIRLITNDDKEYGADGAPEIVPERAICAALTVPDALYKPMNIIGRGYAHLKADDFKGKMTEQIEKYHLEKQPPIMLFSLENHGPAFLQNVEFTFGGGGGGFVTSLVMASTPDHKCKWLFLPWKFRADQKVRVTFTSCYGNKTYADFQPVDLFPDTYPGLFYSCKYYHYHGSKKPTGFGG